MSVFSSVWYWNVIGIACGCCSFSHANRGKGSFFVSYIWC